MKNKKISEKKLYLITGVAIILCAIITAIVLISKGDSTNKKLETQLNLGNSYMDELDYEAAIAAYEEAIRIEPKSEEAYIALANAYIEQGEYEKAIEVLDEGYAQTEAVAISDKKDEIVLLLEEIEEAERQAELAVQAIPTPVPTPLPTEPEVDPYQEKIDHAKQLIENGEPEEAIVELEAAIELEPMNELAYRELAQIYESQEDYESALEILDKGIENTGSEELISYREQILQEIERLSNVEWINNLYTSLLQDDYDSVMDLLGNVSNIREKCADYEDANWASFEFETAYELKADDGTIFGIVVYEFEDSWEITAFVSYGESSYHGFSHIERGDHCVSMAYRQNEISYSYLKDGSKVINSDGSTFSLGDGDVWIVWHM